MKIYALSDIHVDYPDNFRWLEQLDTQRYQQDALLLAGDVSHDMARLARTFELLKQRFSQVFFIPGNHELWTLKRENGHALEKCDRILELCSRHAVHTRPQRLANNGDAVWIVPLFSWYTQPHEGEDSLHVNKDGEDPNLAMWSDFYFIRWPDLDQTPSQHFLARNQPALARTYDAPIISFSHFLPRQDLIFSFPRDQRHHEKRLDPNPSFNFSRVAGSSALDAHIRQLGAVLHVYGHQHRNRCREVDGVTYVSHCLGYGHERANGFIRYLETGPKHIWTVDRGKPASLNHTY